MKAQDLKNSILQLAIQGKLVPQDASDEPAEVLYAKIQSEKQKLIKEGKIKKYKSLPPITDDEVPFSIPPSWKWGRLGDCSTVYTGNSIPEDIKRHRYTGISEGYDYIGTKDVNFDRTISYNNGVKIPYSEPKFKLANKNSILLCIEGGSAGRKLAIVDRDVCFGNKLCSINPINISMMYIFYFIQSPYFRSIFNDNATGIIGGVSVNKLQELLIPLPPLAEQKRIVAKIEEFEPLLKQYEQTETELSTLNDTFPDQLKKSILQYAIQGKLVAQDSNDESAEALYDKIQAEKQKLMKEGKIKKDKPLPPITDDEVPFEIPSTWKWVRLKDICSQITDGEHTTPKRVDKSLIPLLTAKNIRSGYITYDNVDYVDENTAKKCWERCNPRINDIFMTCVGYIGRMSILKEQRSFVIVRSVALIRSLKIYVDYLKYALEAPFSQMQMAIETKQTAQPCLYLNKINEIIIPLPPLAEQKRIVAKVNDLMQYCEELKCHK